jgi:DUF438 domain-containing protein
MMTLSSGTKIADLLGEYPFLLEYLAGLSPQFSRLKSPILLKTIGRVATVRQAAGFGGIPPAELLQKIRAEIERATGHHVEIESDEAPAPPLADREARLEVLKDIIRRLHEGGDLDEQKRRFGELIRDISPAEISKMEQTLIDEGMPEDEVKRLCDVHVQVFKESLAGQPLPSAIPGHPLHTLMEENRALDEHLTSWKRLLDRLEARGADWTPLLGEVAAGLENLAQVEKHYLRKENQLFPLLEAKGVSGPSKVMWAIHDDIRAMLRDLRQRPDGENVAQFIAAGRKLGTAMADMIYKEEKILLPMSLEILDDTDWARVKRGEEEIGYAWVRPGTEWRPAVSAEVLPSRPAYPRPGAMVELATGALTPEQIKLMLTHLPVDVTFVDETDTVRFYSATPERIFPRSPAVIGRKVQNCHPPASVHMVNRILAAFREGSRSSAEFWIQLNERFIHIRYFAVHDAGGAYRGCLEVSQDATAIRGMQGERRLLDWE